MSDLPPKCIWSCVLCRFFSFSHNINLTSARCAKKAMLCTVLPSPISSARIPLIPWWEKRRNFRNELESQLSQMTKCSKYSLRVEATLIKFNFKHLVVYRSRKQPIVHGLWPLKGQPHTENSDDQGNWWKQPQGESPGKGEKTSCILMMYVYCYSVGNWLSTMLHTPR